MEEAIDATATLDYASIQIFPNLKRYEAFVCKGKQSDKVAAGHLEHLLPHLPAINDLHAEGFDTNFDLKLPENLHGAEWFSKATVQRFLHFASSPDLIHAISSILDEMSQLEDSKEFHVSLYGKGNQDHLESGEKDGTYSSHGEAPTSKPEVNIVSSDASKNELLRAMDLRLTALSDKLAETFSKATGATCSPEDLTCLAKFSQHFGATNIEHSLCKFIELTQKSQDVAPLSKETTLHSCDVTKDDANEAVKNLQVSKPLPSDTPVKYGVSPAKAAQVERHSSTESEESSNSSDEDQRSAERSRSLVRSATPRRSASPMRRVQIGRAGPRRAAALTIKSLNYFPGRERITVQDAAENDFEGEVSELPNKKSEIDVKRITVQDAISLFESKQRDQTTDIQKRKSLADVSVSTNKSVLRRWSAGMGETSVQDQPEYVPEDPVPVTSNDVVHAEAPRNSEVGVVSDFISECHNNNEITDHDVKPERQENIGYVAVDNPDETNPTVKQETNKKLAASAEWNQRKQEEFNQILKKMVESKPVLFGKSQPSRNQNISFEQRGGSYDNYKEKRDAKLQGAKAGKQVEKEAQFRQMQRLLDKRKVEMSKSVSASKKSSPRLPQSSLRNSTPPANSPKETSKPSTMKKTSSRTSPMPATRKSWSATPSPRAAGTSPAKARGGISSANSTPTHRKPVSTSVPQPSTQREKSLPRNRNEKEPQTNNARSLKSMNEKRKPAVPNKSKAVKAKVTKASEEASVPSKTSIGNKGTKKSSVVPLESKPFLRKGSRMGHGTADLNKKKGPPKMDKSLRVSADLIEDQESELVVNASDLVSQHSDGDTMTPIHQNAATEPDPQIHNQLQCGETENLDQNPTDGEVLTYTGESSINIRNEEESTISPSAWLETEEDLEMPKPCEDDTFQSASLANAAPVGSASPRVRHSLSQMLQEESSEPDTCEWGNAENPPAMIYQKNAPKGLKRLLKFARKSKGDTGSTGWSSPSVFSEGEDDAEEFKNSNKRNADNLLRKAAQNVKSYGQPKNSVHEGYERNLDLCHAAGRDDGKNKMRDGRDLGAGSTTRASRSFFSLSAFRGSKPSESKFH
ncbi:COP1-interacting protein 7-like isoform X3 [Glycine soja]|uniref:COP1-interacting protein 7 isoform C n=1 Tax=Glycine soja TaxID=3848 RepID=A0A445K9H1_GLYSO|nr:COP1-interacting protein 7-like isoform X3 [Glycine soja]RZC07428.1 COP1-interacting protein 7 isoform C [Glycine soja]RZC07429.1 COP1-interacting protein 7 isoform D [Glycine soja]